MAQYAASLSESPGAYTDSPGGRYDPNSPTTASEHPTKSRCGKHFPSFFSNSSAATYVEPEPSWLQDNRIWITASREPQCSAARRRTIILCFDGTGDQFDSDVCAYLF